MKKAILSLLFTILVLNNISFSQCPNNNAFYLDLTPTSCPGSASTSLMWAGEYVTVNVISGNTYIFSTCGGASYDTELTLYTSGGTFIAYNDDACGVQSEIIWVATYTGVVNVVLDEYSCLSNFLNTSLSVTCLPPGASGSGCNANVSICSAGTAGPFSFGSAGTDPNNCLDWYALSTYSYIVLNITQSGNLNLLINGNSAFGYLDASIHLIPPGVDPCVAVTNPSNQLSCNYASAFSGCNQIGNCFGCSSLITPSPFVTAGSQIMIVVENWLSNDFSNLYQSQVSNFTLQLCPNAGSAQTGPFNAAINPVAPLCVTSTPITVGSVTGGGFWSASCGGCINSSTGVFNPAIAGAGSHLINYTVGGAPCTGADATTIVVNPITTPTFNPVGPYCNGEVIPALPTTSIEGVTGSWSPAINNTATTTYTFTPNPGQCASTTTMAVTINTNVTPTFAAVGPYCNGAAIPALPTASTNSITGTWSPAINNTATTLYTFTPTVGQCASTTSLTITVNPNITPTFTPVLPYCNGATISTLPTTSTNSITGTWSPAINNTATTLYTFTPTAGQCATTSTLTITVNPTNTISVGGNITTCINSAMTPITLSTTGATGATVTGLPAGVTGTWAGNVVTISGTPTASGTFNYTVTTTGGCPPATTTGTITVTPLNTVAAGTSQTVCINSTITTITLATTGATGATVTGLPAGVTGTWIGNIVTISGTPTASGTFNYTVTTSGGCPPAITTGIITVNNESLPTFTSVGPYCNGSAIPALPTTSTNSITGIWSPAINNTTTTLYTFTPTAGQCASTTTQTITVNNAVTPTFAVVGSYCNGASIPALPTTSTNSITGTWSPAINNTATTLYTFTPTAGQCATTTTQSLTVNTLPTLPTLPTMTQSACALSTGSLTGAVASGNGTLSYSWTNSSSVVVGTSANLTNIPAGTYNLTVTDGNGCSQLFGPYSVTNPGSPAAPTIVVSDNSVCVGESFTLTASSGAASPTFQWTGPNSSSATNTLTVSSAVLADNGSYSVTVTSANCTSTAATVVVAVNANPVASAGANTTVNCLNPTPTLTATGGTSYSWNTPSGTVSGSTINLTSASTGGTYTVTATDGNGCTDTDAITVTIDVTTPTALVATPSQINCTTPTITLDGTGSTNTGGTTVGLTYAWTASNGGNISSGASTATPSVSSAGDYTLTVTQANGCTNAVTVSVTADASVPVANITTPGVLNCSNSTLILDGTGSTGAGLTYTWTTTGGTIDSGASTSSATISAPGTYTLTIEASNGCTNVTSVVVTQDLTAPTTLVAAPIEVDCANPTITLDGSASTSGGTITYAWTTSNGTITGSTTGNTVTVTSAGDYTLTVTNTANGCTSNQQVTVTENTTLPVANAGANVNLTCASSTVTLDGTTSSGTGITYSWTGPSVVSGGATATPTVGQAGTYTLTVTGSNGCTATATVDVIPDANAPIADAGSNTVIDCNTATVTLDGSGSAAGTDITYTWTTTTGNIISGTSSNQATVDAAGTYTLEVANTTNGCSSFASVNVTLDTTPPTANAGSAQVVSCTTPTVTLDGTASTGTGLTYTWTTTTGNIVGAANTATVVADAAGTYTLTVTGSNGCTNSTTVNVTGNTTVPTANFSLNTNIGNIPLNIITTNTSTGSNLSFSWDFGDGNSSNLENPTNLYNSIGTFIITLTVMSDNGCIDVITDTITVIGESTLTIPNIFSPNGDSNNDVFNLLGTNIKEIKGLIFNRWGHIVYDWNALESGWDGRTISGLECAEGTYYYIIDAIGADGKEFHFEGPLQLVR